MISSPSFHPQNTVDKLIKKTNLALVIGTHSWREQFLEAVTVSAGKWEGRKKERERGMKRQGNGEGNRKRDEKDNTIEKRKNKKEIGKDRGKDKEWIQTGETDTQREMHREPRRKTETWREHERCRAKCLNCRRPETERRRDMQRKTSGGVEGVSFSQEPSGRAFSSDSPRVGPGYKSWPPRTAWIPLLPWRWSPGHPALSHLRWFPSLGLGWAHTAPVWPETP